MTNSSKGDTGRRPPAPSGEERCRWVIITDPITGEEVAVDKTRVEFFTTRCAHAVGATAAALDDMDRGVDPRVLADLGDPWALEVDAQ